MTPTPTPNPTEAERLRARAAFNAALLEDEAMRNTHSTYAHARRAERQQQGELE